MLPIIIGSILSARRNETLLTLGVKLQNAGTAVRFDNKGYAVPPTSVLLGGDVVHRFAEVHQLTIATAARYYAQGDQNVGVGRWYRYD